MEQRSFSSASCFPFFLYILCETLCKRALHQLRIALDLPDFALLAVLSSQVKLFLVQLDYTWNHSKIRHRLCCYSPVEIMHWAAFASLCLFFSRELFSIVSAAYQHSSKQCFMLEDWQKLRWLRILPLHRHFYFPVPQQKSLDLVLIIIPLITECWDNRERTLWVNRCSQLKNKDHQKCCPLCCLLNYCRYRNNIILSVLHIQGNKIHF